MQVYFYGSGSLDRVHITIVLLIIGFDYPNMACKYTFTALVTRLVAHIVLFC